MKGFNVMALDKDYQIVALLRYTELQWSRKYYEPGSFSLEIPLEQYDTSYKYIYTYERPEMGIIEQVNYIDYGNYRYVALSGFFLENLLNRRVAYPKSTSNITNAPSWANYTGKAEDVAFAYFNAFKDVAFGGKTYQLGIETGTNSHRGHASDHLREGEELGSKIYTILKPSEMSYRVSYDFLTSNRVFSVWTGNDRTQDNTAGNNAVIFSTRNGTANHPNVLLDNTKYKSAAIVENTTYDNNVEVNYDQAFIYDEEEDYEDKFVFLRSVVMKSDYSSTAAYYAAMIAEGQSKMPDYTKTTNITFDALEGSYEYRIDFDLGDKCSVEIPEVGISADAVLIGVYEVVKSGSLTLTLEFGDPILK